MQKYKKIALILLALIMLTVIFPQSVSAAGNVATAIKSTWTEAAKQIKTVCDGVVFPAVDLVLAVLFFVKLGTSYFEFKKHGQFEFTGAAILFFGLIFMLTAPLYIWNILNI
jgi:hypothetical protein